MKKSALLAAVCVPAFLAAAPLAAKTLVFCSEGSPENFYPGVNTTGTSFDANEPDLQPHRRLRARRHQGRARPGGEVGHLAGRHRLHLPPAQGREVAHQRATSSRRATLNADDIMFTLERQWKEDNPYFKVTSSEPLLLQRHGHAQAAEVGGEGRRLHGQDHAQPAGSAVPVGPGDAIRRRPVEGICRRHAEGRHAGEDRPGADRHRPVLSGPVPEGRHDPLQGVPASTGAARPRSTTWCSRSRRTPRCAGPSCRRANAT